MASAEQRSGQPQQEEKRISRRQFLTGAIETGAGVIVAGAGVAYMSRHEKQSLGEFLLADTVFSAGVVAATIGIMTMATSPDHGQNEILQTPPYK
jgi:hypothetical protein